MNRVPLLIAASLCLATGACMNEQTVAASPYPTVGRIDRQSTGLDALIASDAKLEVLGEGYQWSEGPVWIPEGGYLLFTDVPGNRMHRWKEGEGVTVFLEPSGYSGPPTKDFREPGANGLIRGPGNTILMADHGNRGIASLDLSTKEKSFLVDSYQGKRFNSPNDLARASSGSIYFTDPPYGLEGLNESPIKELPFNGVYRLDPEGNVTLIDDALSFPNGVILSPDQRKLYVAVSDPERAIVMAYSLDEKGDVASKRLFADLTSEVGPDRPGLPDGMTVDNQGNLFVTGPGGVIVFAPDGTRLGTIVTGTGVANVTFGEDGQTLFLTSHNMLVRLRTKTSGVGF